MDNDKNNLENKKTYIYKIKSITGLQNIPESSCAFPNIMPLDENELDELRKKRVEREKKEAYLIFDYAKKSIVQLKYDQAISLLRQITEKFPKEAQFHSYLGLAMQRKGRTAYAQAEFKVALQNNPQEQIALQFYRKQEENFNQYNQQEK